MNARIDISGRKFGRLTAVVAASWGPTSWLCACECGTEITVKQGNLRNGHTRSCGCLKKENVSNLIHGHTRSRSSSRTFRAYSNAKTRCFNPKNKSYSDYGGRGIRMCEEWRSSFEAFLRDMGECPAGKTLERNDVNGDYDPNNCRWATPAEQSRNKRNNVLVDLNGKTFVLKDFAEVRGVEYHSLHSLMKYHCETPQVIADRMIERRRGVLRTPEIIKR